MRHHVYTQADRYPVAIMVKNTAFNLSEIKCYYIDALDKLGVRQEDLIIVALPYNENGKAPVGFIKEQLNQILPQLLSLGVEVLYCADAAYFKVLSKKPTAAVHLGYILPTAMKDYEDQLFVTLGINQKTLMYDPKNETKLRQSLEALADHRQNTYVEPGVDLSKCRILTDLDKIDRALTRLHDHGMLTADIEGASLRFEQAGIGTITFCWGMGEGIAFPVDYKPLTQRERQLQTEIPGCENVRAKMVPNPEVRALLKRFLTEYQGELIWHHVNYDLKVLICELWMESLLDTAGMLEGLRIMTRSFHDTKVITYLATNSTAGNELGLKTIAHEFAGNWGKNVKDITKLEQDELLEYNLIDGLSTWYVFKKHFPAMVRDQQKDIYYNLMLPSLRTLIQTELTGMPLNPKRVQEVKHELETELKQHTNTLENSPAVQTLNNALQREAMEAANAKLKIKQHPLSKFTDVKFNPNSPTQITKLLYQQLGLPVLDLTDTKLPSTGAKTLKKLLHHSKDQEMLEILNALVHYSEVEKILSSFIPAFERAISKGQENTVWLHGSFNLGGTVSGRLSSSDPNLQNLPSNSTYGKAIKSCFQTPAGWLFVGADFNSLEDYVSALQTRDPNKLKIYIDGFDGHCLRAFHYFGDDLPDIIETPESVNSIKKKYPEIRQDSKAPTFLLTYGGTYHGLMKNLGWDKVRAKHIEKSYHDLYSVSDEWVQARLDEAAKCGYVTCAFGLRVRTPILHKTLRNNRMNPYEAKSEARTAGNALGQSYGLLTNRAFNQFMKEVWESSYWDSILPIGLIHDAIYLVVRDDVHIVEWVNRHLIRAMQWQELPELQHDTVKLGAELSIFWPSWASELTLPNNISKAEIRHLTSRLKKEILKNDQTT